MTELVDRVVAQPLMPSDQQLNELYTHKAKQTILNQLHHQQQFPILHKNIKSFPVILRFRINKKTSRTQ